MKQKTKVNKLTKHTIGCVKYFLILLKNNPKNIHHE